MGECCSMIQSIPEEVLTKNLFLPQDYSDTVIKKEEILKLGVNFYVRALKLQPNEASLWHDLGHILQSLDLDRALRVMKRALSLDSTNHQYWNSLGYLAFHKSDYRLAQHCFIRSVELEPSSVAWTNLGVLYTILSSLNLANYAFKQSQNVDPTYVKGWAGQAYLAELVESDEALDLFRHSTLLGNEIESSLAFSYWVCKTMYAMASNQDVPSHNRYCLEKMYGIISASDCMDRVLRRIPHDKCASNLYGIILEKMNMFTKACAVLSSAIVHDKNEDILLENLGRVYLKAHRFEEAITCFKSISKENFSALIGLALACHRTNQFKEAYVYYQRALKCTEDVEIKSQVLTAMAMIAFHVQGPGTCKTLLFQAVSTKSVSVDGLFALCVLGIKSKDSSLIQATFKELVKRPESPDQILIQAAVLAVQNKISEVLSVLVKAVHRRPDSVMLWRALTLRLANFEPKLSRKCAIKWEKMSNADDHGDVQASINAYLSLDIDQDAALTVAMKAAHKYPYSGKSWSVLLSCLKRGSLRYRIGLKSRVISEMCMENKSLIRWIESFVEA